MMMYDHKWAQLGGRGSCKVRITQVRKLELRTFQRTLRAIAEWSHPRSARRRDCLQIEDFSTASLILCMLGEEEVLLEEPRCAQTCPHLPSESCMGLGSTKFEGSGACSASHTCAGL